MQAGHPRHGGRHLIEDGDRCTFQQRDPAAQAVGKLQLALHGRRRHRRHLIAHSSQTGYFVDALDPDRGGIHVHHQQPGFSQGRQDGEMADIDVPLLPLDGLHQLGREAVCAEQKQRNTGLLPQGIEAGFDLMVCQQPRHLCQVASIQRLAKQDEPGVVVGTGCGQQGFRGKLPAGNTAQGLGPVMRGTGELGQQHKRDAFLGDHGVHHASPE